MLDSLQHLFPALEGTLDLGALHIGRDEALYGRLRTANQHAQQRSADGSLCAWKKLDRIVCPPVAFYLLCLRCPVRLAIIDGTDGYYDLEVVQRCIAVSLRENPVPHLTLCLALDDGLGLFRVLLPPELGNTLTHLTLVLDAVGHGSPAVAFGSIELLVRTSGAPF